MPNFKPDFVIRNLESRATSPSRTPVDFHDDSHLWPHTSTEQLQKEKINMKLNQVKRLASLSKAAYSRTPAHYNLPENSKFETLIRKAKPIESRKSVKSSSNRSRTSKLEDEGELCSRYLKFINPIESNPFRTGLNTMINKAYNGVFNSSYSK